MKKIPIFIPIVFLLCFTFGCQQPVEKGVTEEEAKVLFDKVLEIWNNGNLDLVEEVFAPEIIAHTSTFPDDIVGYDGIKDWVKFAHAAFPDLHMTFGEPIIKNDKIVALCTVTGTNTGPMSMPTGELPPTGQKVTFTGIGIDVVKDGKIIKETFVYNVLEMMMQLGFTLTPPLLEGPPEEKK